MSQGEDPARTLAELFSRFGPAMHRWLRAGVDREGMTFARMRLMRTLEDQGPLIMSEIKDRLDVSARNITSLVDGLEDAGYVRREPHPEDRRATLVELTEDGRATLRSVHREHIDRAARLFARLDPDDQRELARIMDQLLEHLDDEQAG